MASCSSKSPIALAIVSSDGSSGSSSQTSAAYKAAIKVDGHCMPQLFQASNLAFFPFCFGVYPMAGELFFLVVLGLPVLRPVPCWSSSRTSSGYLLTKSGSACSSLHDTNVIFSIVDNNNKNNHNNTKRNDRHAKKYLIVTIFVGSRGIFL